MTPRPDDLTLLTGAVWLRCLPGVVLFFPTGLAHAAAHGHERPSLDDVLVARRLRRRYRRDLCRRAQRPEEGSE